MSFMSTLPRPTKTYHSETYERISKNHGFDGKGKTILITGGASGIGYHMSKAFAEAGVARIAVISRSEDAQKRLKSELSTSHPSVQLLPFQSSITDNERMIKIFEELGTVDVLVLNAAVAHGRGQASDISSEDVREAFEINTIATFNITKAYLATPMPASGQKSIINVSTAAIQLVGSPRVAYGASKAAGAQLLQSFASQYKDGSVRIFSFHPGSYYTPGVAKNIPKHMFQWEDEKLPADFTVWLAGPESGFLHGRHLWANWDVDELIELKDRFEKDPSFLTIGLIQ